jgi:hypothetical protein
MEEQVRILKRKRDSLGYIEEFLDEFDRNPVGKENVAVRHEGLNEIWEKFSEVQDELEIQDSDLEVQYQERREFHVRFYSVKARIQRILNSRVKSEMLSQQSSTSSHKSPSVKLPTISLPTFDGSFTEWTRFKLTFESLIVNNEGLDNVQKFHYLISSLKKEPSLLLQNLEISNENFSIAWELLVN